MTEVEIIDRVIKILSKNQKISERYSAEIKNFSARLERAQQNKYRLGIIGVTSCGKSTLINALLGEKLLPAVARPSSSQLVSCYHGKQRAATIFFEGDTKLTIPSQRLASSIIEKYADESKNRDNKEGVKQIEISSPKFPFADNLILIDSPGLDAYGYAGHEQLTMNSLLPTIDFCIFVTTCKTNSDDKTLSVLNTVAEYDKPIIIVQNMIDSLKPSLDGKKTVEDVAQEHKTRVERIVTKSQIIDKRSVYIVQISAINALNSRLKSRLNLEEERIFRESNYSLLISTVNNAFNEIRPRIEGARMTLLKKEIYRISADALKDGSGIVPSRMEFQYENIDEDYKKCRQDTKNIMNKASKEMDELRNKYDDIHCRKFDQNDIDNILQITHNVETTICARMKITNERISDVCLKLNVDTRSIYTDFRFEKTSLTLRHKHVVNPRGHWVEGKRTWKTLWLFKTGGHWEPTTKTVVDASSSLDDAKTYIKNAISAYKRTINRWTHSIEITERNLYQEINNRRNEFENRKKHAIDCQKSLEIGNELQSIANNIPQPKTNRSSTKGQRTDVTNAQLYPVRDCWLYSLYLLSENIRYSIHKETMKALISAYNMNEIIGWDENCEAIFAKTFFNSKIKSLPSISVGYNEINTKLRILHKPNKPFLKKKGLSINIFVLVNATQFGAALKEIDALQLKKSISANDKLFFVVQDFQEIINGNAIEETLDNMKLIVPKLSIQNKSKILILHDNPLYNLAIAEAQVRGCHTQQDEIEIIHDLQKDFYYLFPDKAMEKRKVETILKIIIQKAGKI